MEKITFSFYDKDGTSYLEVFDHVIEVTPITGLKVLEVIRKELTDNNMGESLTELDFVGIE